MIEYDKIEIGDCVSVSFHGSQFTLCRKAIVMAMPIYDYNDKPLDNTWIFKDFDDHKIHYVSEGVTVSLIQKALPTHQEIRWKDIKLDPDTKYEFENQERKEEKNTNDNK